MSDLDGDGLEIARIMLGGSPCRPSKSLDVSDDVFEKGDRVEALRQEVYEQFRHDAFRDEFYKNPPCRGTFGYAYIPLKEGAVPTRQKPFVMHGERREAYEKITRDWLECGFIEKPTTFPSEWLNQGFAVPKKSAEFPWRGVADMRGPNSQTRRCNYPLPCIEDILVKQGACHIFSILDLKKAFHQQPLQPESRHITCTYTPLGVFQWTVNVMGLMNAGVQFQKMIDDRLQPVSDVASPYIDDIIVGTRVEQGDDPIEVHKND